MTPSDLKGLDLDDLNALSDSAKQALAIYVSSSFVGPSGIALVIDEQSDETLLALYEMLTIDHPNLTRGDRSLNDECARIVKARLERRGLEVPK